MFLTKMNILQLNLVGENYTAYIPRSPQLNFEKSTYKNAQPFYDNTISELISYADSLGVYVSLGGNLLGGSGSVKRSYPEAFVDCP